MQKKMNTVFYVLIMLLFSIPLLVVGYIVAKDEHAMFMPLMFVLVFGMRSIDNYARG